MPASANATDVRCCKTCGIPLVRGSRYPESPASFAGRWHCTRECRSSEFYRAPTLHGNYIELPLNRGGPAFIDSTDDWLLQWTWTCTVNGYPAARINGHQVKMHHAIMHPLPGFVVDHINGNPADNRRSNLRVVDYFGNRMAGNVRPRSDCASGMRGVHFDRQRERWRGCVQIAGKNWRTRAFETKEEALAALNAMRKAIGLEPVSGTGVRHG